MGNASSASGSTHAPKQPFLPSLPERRGSSAAAVTPRASLWPDAQTPPPCPRGASSPRSSGTASLQPTPVLAPPAVPPPPGETLGLSVLPQPGRNPWRGQLSPLPLPVGFPHPRPLSPKPGSFLPQPHPPGAPGEQSRPPSQHRIPQDTATKGRHQLGQEWGTWRGVRGGLTPQRSQQS